MWVNERQSLCTMTRSKIDGPGWFLFEEQGHTVFDALGQGILNFNFIYFLSLISLSPVFQKAWELATTLICDNRGYKLKTSDFRSLSTTSLAEHVYIHTLPCQRTSIALALTGFSSWDVDSYHKVNHGFHHRCLSKRRELVSFGFMFVFAEMRFLDWMSLYWVD